MTSIAVLQSPLGSKDPEENIGQIEELTIQAAQAGAEIVLAPELFEVPYFPQTQDESWFEYAKPYEEHPTVERFRMLSERYRFTLPVSFFERATHTYFNSVALVSHGAVLGAYRKTHIPDGPGYQEKYYFRPGNSGFRALETPEAWVGVGICWDQWFPEVARSFCLQGAELLLYPTCIGSEPSDPTLDTRDPWRRVMIGHAVANACVVAAANRVGTEDKMCFYGSSFVCDARGDILAELDRTETGFALAAVDFTALRRYRAGWGFFRDRRPDLYETLTRCDTAKIG
ncbi:MAG: nitrilase-related carbon-nitrogen hydrolase [Myxococcota bacterium]